MAIRAGVDVGGTFTDVVLLDETTGELTSTKVPTDYDDPLVPIVAGLAALGSGEPIAALHHATTLATNAIIQGQLPAGALLTTTGFRDVLDIGRIQRPEAGIYDFNIDNPAPLIPRRFRIEVSERIGSRGEVVTELDERDLRQQLQNLRASAAPETVAVSCLFSFLNPAHERRIAEIVMEELPDAYVSTSYDVAPEIREFERTSTVVLDALLKPMLTPYLSALHQRLSGEGVDHTRVMMASGGLTSCDNAAQRPVTMINSGPSAGVLAAANLGRQMGLDDLITIDMGGTSLDIGVVEGGASVERYESQIAGYPLRSPSIDVAAIAAGGGSLASVDRVGYIQVDRESAGSVPGPACYGRGGARPTITDADIVLGRLGGKFGGHAGLTLDPELAMAAFEGTICRDLGVSIADAAASVLDIIQARMVKAIAANTLEKGLDIRHLPLLVYGGAGPTHGVELADAMNMNRAIIPNLAGSFSAIGLLLCPLRWDASMMLLKASDAVTRDDLNNCLRELNDISRSQIEASGATASLETNWQVHMRYAGQSYDLPVSIGMPWPGELPNTVIEQLEEAFHALHERHYAYRSETETIELVQVRCRVSGTEMAFPKPPGAPTADAAALETREVYFTAAREPRTASVWDRGTLAVGTVVSGPALIEGQGSCALIPPDWTAAVDPWLNLDVRRL